MDRATSLLALATLLAVGCTGKPSDATGRRQQAAPAEPVAKAAPEFVKAAADGAAIVELVKASQRQAVADGRRLVVYVGAPWCEPCQAFHRAVEAGQLDAELAGIRFLEFDADEHRDALVSGGYGGRLIPRFALPGPDGRGDEARKIEGGTKGDGAVEYILRRLEPLLAGSGA
jgi:thiol-disulfide isomerase/thioredoxin